LPDDAIVYEIFIRKGDQGGPFVVEDPETIKDYAAMLSIAKDIVNRGEVDEAVLLQKRVLKRIKKYGGNG
jgi:hypothetical protein